MQKITICGTDLSQFAILLPSDPAPAEVTAAEYLQKTVLATVGMELPITCAPTDHNIVLGAGSTEGIKYDGFIVSTDGASIYLRGRIPRGTLYAAYDFTERFLGVRHFAPDTAVLPTEGTAEIPVGYFRLDNPVFDQRLSSWISYFHSDEHSAHSRINGRVRDEKYGGGSKLSAGAHTFMALCPPDQYFAEHPEYYSLWQGKRIPAGQLGEGVGQLCLTNPDVLRIVTENVLAQLRANPELRVVDVSQNDNQNYCCCPECARIDELEGSHSGTMIRFVNAIAEEIEDEFPDVLVQTFAYQYSRKAPKVTKPHKNVLIRYCTIEACFRHPLNDPDCQINGSVFVSELAQWGKVATQMMIWDYTTNYTCFVTPFPNYEVLLPNARFFAENKAIGVYEEHMPDSYAGEFGDLQAYLVGKLLWNPYMSEEEFDGHRREFLAAYYGPGWENIYRYMMIELEETAEYDIHCFENSCDGFHVIYDGDDAGSENYVPQAYQYTPEDSCLSGMIARLDELHALWAAALDAAETDRQRMHIERSYMSLRYVDLFTKPHIKEAMSLDEQAVYEAEVQKYLQDVEKFGFDYNISTIRKTRRERGGINRPIDRA